MDPDAEDFSSFLVRYKSGRVHRLMGTSRVGAGTDDATGVICKDAVVDASAGLAARLYLPKGVPRSKKLPVLVYFHGGAFAVHSAVSAVHYRFLNALVAAAEGSAWGGEESALYETAGEGHVYFLEKSGWGDRAEKEIRAVVSFIKRS